MNTLLPINTFFSVFLFAWTMQISHIIPVLLFITHQFIFLFYFFSSTHPPPPLWMVDAMFIFILFFLSRLTFVQFGIHSVVSSYAWFICFILCYLSWVYTFSIMFIPHCKYFFLSSCTRNMAHNAVNTRSQSLLHRKYMCTRPVRQMPFGVTTLKIEDINVGGKNYNNAISFVYAGDTAFIIIIIILQPLCPGLGEGLGMPSPS